MKKTFKALLSIVGSLVLLSAIAISASATSRSYSYATQSSCNGPEVTMTGTFSKIKLQSTAYCNRSGAGVSEALQIHNFFWNTLDLTQSYSPLGLSHTSWWFASDVDEYRNHFEAYNNREEYPDHTYYDHPVYSNNCIMYNTSN